MQRSIVEQHINDFDYQAALDLIRDHGDDSFATRYLGMNQSSFTEKKVKKHLEEWMESLSDEPVTTGISPEPIGIAKLRSEKNALLAQRDHLKGQLELIPTDAERKRVALHILSIDQKIKEHWEDIHTLEAGKELAKEDPEDELAAIFEGITNVLTIEKIRRNHVTYLSKAKKGIRPKENIPFYQRVIAEAERRKREFV